MSAKPCCFQFRGIRVEKRIRDLLSVISAVMRFCADFKFKFKFDVAICFCQLPRPRRLPTCHTLRLQGSSQEVPFACPPPFFCTVVQIRGAGSLDGEVLANRVPKETHSLSRDKRRKVLVVSVVHQHFTRETHAQKGGTKESRVTSAPGSPGLCGRLKRGGGVGKSKK